MLPLEPNQRLTKVAKEPTMRKHVWMVSVALLIGQARAEEPRAKPVQDLWDAAYIGSAKIGSLHTSVREVVRDGEKRLRTSQDLELTIKRYKAIIRVRAQIGSEETKEGKITSVFMTQFLDKDHKLELKGEVEEGGLHVQYDGGRVDKTIRWNDKVQSAYRQELIFKERKVKAGDRLSLLSYDPQYNSVVTINALVKEPEEVDLLSITKEGDMPKVKRIKEKLLRVELKPANIELPGKSIEMPGWVWWLNKDWQPVRSQLEMPGLGNVVLYRTTRAVALLPSSGEIPDLGTNTRIALNQRLEQPEDTESVTYRVTYKGEGDPATTLAKDDRQEITNVKGKTFELKVRAIRAPGDNEKPEPAKGEFLKTSYYLDSDNAQVQAIAKKAVGKETEPWKKALAIETWVHKHMRHDDSVAFCPAGQVAENLKGDCRQHAMLMTAVCRAAGIGSRPAVGLVYVEDRKRSPALVYHMWTEVWINGQWIALDATRGQGAVGATHIKISDHSWQGITSQTPFLPVQRVLGKLAIEIISEK
jgi:transglutaminase-like putative cysteine protease